jgi:hypothetical protein
MQDTTQTLPRALVVLLENVGHIHGVPLPNWAQNAIDFLTEEYAKARLRWFGAYRRYDRVIILEDDAATGTQLVDALLALGNDYTTDLLLLVHGRQGSLVGYRDQTQVDKATFDRLEAIYATNPHAFHLRMVFGLNCYGVSLGPVWLNLGAKIVNGACGVNGDPYSIALMASHSQGLRWGQRIWQPDVHGNDHPRIAGSRQVIYGVHDVTIFDP